MELFTDEDKIKFLEHLGYEVIMYSVDARMRQSGYHAMIYKHYDYEVFKDGICEGTLHEVFKTQLLNKLLS